MLGTVGIPGRSSPDPVPTRGIERPSGEGEVTPRDSELGRDGGTDDPGATPEPTGPVEARSGYGADATSAVRARATAPSPAVSACGGSRGVTADARPAVLDVSTPSPPGRGDVSASCVA